MLLLFCQTARKLNHGCAPGIEQEFIAFMHAQLKLYVQRHIASAMLEAETSASHKDSAVLFVLKHLIVAMETLMRGQVMSK